MLRPCVDCVDMARRSKLIRRLKKALPSKRTRAAWLKRYKQSSPYTQMFVGFAVLFTAWLIINVLYQVIRKPTELFFPVDHALYKSPTETWDAYAPIFRKHSTVVITPEFLAALAQVEASGNPVARTYWRWSLTDKPFEIFKPASSAVGMYQITDGTFEQARKLCIHDHVVVDDGRWNEWRSCWFNWLYFRVVPSHAVEMTSAYLDRSVANTLQRFPRRNVTLKQKQTLATLIHLCGAGAGRSYAARGYQLSPGQRCGDHSAAGYVAKVASMQSMFSRLAAKD
jgi:hypothetical protein